MILLRDVVCQFRGKGLGCPLISVTFVECKGALLQAKGGGGQPAAQNVTQNTAPWSGVQPYLSTGFGRAQSDILNRPQAFFPNQTYANFSPQTEQALNLTEQRALAGSPVHQSASDQLMATLNGDYLHGGPGFDAAYQAAANKIIPDVESRFARGGRFGSGLAREAETRALGDAFASQYGDERTNQLRAMLFAPQLAQMDYTDLAALGGVGGAREEQAQAGINEQMARHNFAQQEPMQRVRDYMAAINGNFQEQQAFENKYRGSRGAGFLGGALGGAAMGAHAGAAAGAGLGPWGAGIGGVLGGIGGLF